MAKLPNISTKHLQIDKANKSVVIVIAIAAFLIVFSIFASKALLSQRSYQGKVIKEKTTAVKQLKTNLDESKKLVSSYKDFVSTSENVLGGNPKGTGDKDGDNAKIVLDALPSKYDFPALTSSLEKVLKSQNFKIESIVGIDDELNQKNTTSPNPVPLEIPFQITVSGSYVSMKTLVETLQKSIRPFQIQKMELSGNDASVRLTITAKTYYQPEKNLNITPKEVK